MMGSIAILAVLQHCNGGIHHLILAPQLVEEQQQAVDLVAD
jgi:hypothetical protein